MIKLIYIASPSYSGSTLLTFLMNAHPQIATIGELKWGTIDLDTYRCSCGELLRECGFWHEIQARVEAQGLPFDLRLPPTDFRFPDHPLADRFARARNRGPIFEAVRQAAIAVSPVCRERWPTIAAVNRAAVEAILSVQGGTIFLDGSKDPVRLSHLIATGDYDIRVIHLVRDGRGVVYSTMKNKGLSPEVAATDWLRTHDQIDRVGSRLPSGSMLGVRYEDLCRDVAKEMARIFDFSGVSPDEWAANPGGVEHHILGNSMRLSAERSIALDEKWRNALTTEQLADFEAIAGDENRALGYD